MRYIIRVPIAISALLTSTAFSNPKAGVGINPVDILFIYSLPQLEFIQTVRVPIIVDKFKILPELSFGSYTETDRPGYSSTERTYTWNTFGAGLGFLFLVPRDKFYFGFGPVVLFEYVKTTSEEGTSTDENTMTGISGGLELQPEYFLNDHFSISGEVRLTVGTQNEVDRASSMTSDDETERFHYGMNNGVFFNWYF